MQINKVKKFNWNLINAQNYVFLDWEKNTVAVCYLKTK